MPTVEKLDKMELIEYILDNVKKRVSKNEQELYIISTALKDKKNVKINIETTFGQISNIVIWIKEKRGLYRKLSL